jgi:Second Messenger Oligonucleotide or Dinucleotide Synthetase domain
MGLADWFKGFCDDLQIQDGGTISTRYKAITRRLNTDFRTTTSETSHSLYVGSYGRNTAIKGISDLDMVYELPAALYEVRQASGKWPISTSSSGKNFN